MDGFCTSLTGDSAKVTWCLTDYRSQIERLTVDGSMINILLFSTVRGQSIIQGTNTHIDLGYIEL